MSFTANISKNKIISPESPHSGNNVKYIFKKIFKESNVPKFVVDRNSKIIEVNKEFCNVLGYTKKELIGKSLYKIIADDFVLKSKKVHSKLIGETQFLKVEEKYKRKNGTSFYALSTNIKVSDESGQPYRVVSLIDISERMQYELIQSIQLNIANKASFCKHPLHIYETIMNSLSELFSIDLMSVYLNNENGSLAKVFQKKKKKKENFDNYLIPAIENISSSVILKEPDIRKILFSKGVSSNCELPKTYIGIPLKAGENKSGLITIVSYEKINPVIAKDLSFLDIISSQIAMVIERNKYENELKAAKEKAEEASRLKSEFLAQISHEVRTPLNSILSFSNLIESELNGSLSEELKESFDMIRRGGDRLRRTIELLLNASQVQNGKYKVHIENINLEKNILIPIIKQFESAAEEKGLKLEYDNNLKNSNIVCDLYTTGQIFINLIDNAIKYTHKGKIVIKVFKNENGQIQVDIIDTGIGISEEYLPKIFETFSQEETGYTRKYEGIGLGLSLVKEYAAINEIEIKVDSKKGLGSKFSVVFK